MKQTAIISQPFGIGDAIFAQGIADYLIAQKYNVMWPVKSHFVDGLQKAYPYVQWVPDAIINPFLFNIKRDYVVDGIRIIPIRWSNEIIGVPASQWMRSKYDMYGLDWSKWKNHAHYYRNLNKERELCNLYGIDITKPYNLININYRTDGSGKIAVQIKNNHPKYVMDVKEGFSLFDYSTLIENATEIHVANSAILYLLELLDFKGTAHIYARPEEGGGFPHVDYIMTKNYVLHS